MSQFELAIRETVATTNLFQSVASKKSDKRAEYNLGKIWVTILHQLKPMYSIIMW